MSSSPTPLLPPVTNQATRSPESLAVRKRVKRNTIWGASLMGIGGLYVFMFPSAFLAIQKSILVIKEDSFWLDYFTHPPGAADIQFFIWNIENPVQFSQGAKARLKAKGPYVYSVSAQLEVMSWEDDGRTFKFWMKPMITYNDKATKGSRDDRISVINLPVYAMVGVVRHYVRKVPFMSSVVEPVVLSAINLVVQTQDMGGLVKQITAGELFEGYEFGPLYYADIFIKNVLPLVERYMARPLAWLGIQIPLTVKELNIKDSKLGLMSIKNNTRVGPFHLYTGQKGTQFFKAASNFGKTQLSAFDDPKCNKYNGSLVPTIEAYPNKKTRLNIFTPELCRAIYFAYKEKTSMGGAPTLRFIMPPSMYASPSKNPDNKCYCQTPDDEEMCDGIYDMGPCYFGAPLALSHSHLLFASDKIRDTVLGVHPIQELHESYLELEPSFAVPLAARIGIQLNILLEGTSYVSEFEDVRDAVLPYLLINIVAEMDGWIKAIEVGVVWFLFVLNYGLKGMFYGGLGLNGYTSYYAIRKRDKLFERKRQTFSPTNNDLNNTNYKQPVRQVDNQNVNPPTNYYQEKPPVYTISQPQQQQPVPQPTQPQPLPRQQQQQYQQQQTNGNNYQQGDNKQVQFANQTSPAADGYRPATQSGLQRVVSPPGSID